MMRPADNKLPSMTHPDAASVEEAPKVEEKTSPELGLKAEARKRDAIAAQNAGSIEHVHIPSIPKDEATIRFLGAQLNKLLVSGV